MLFVGDFSSGKFNFAINPIRIESCQENDCVAYILDSQHIWYRFLFKDHSALTSCLSRLLETGSSSCRCYVEIIDYKEIDKIESEREMDLYESEFDIEMEIER